MRRAAGLAIAAAALAALAAFAAPAAADPMPAGRLTVLVGGKTGTGRLANDIGSGWALGAEASYQPMGPTQRVGWGVAWSTVWSYYSGGARVSGTLGMIELDLGLRARVALGARRRQVLWLGGGGSLLRTNDPILPDGPRDFVGPFGAAGVDIPIWRLVLVVDARYGLIDAGQGTFGVLAGVGTGR